MGLFGRDGNAALVFPVRSAGQAFKPKTGIPSTLGFPLARHSQRTGISSAQPFKPKTSVVSFFLLCALCTIKNLSKSLLRLSCDVCHLHIVRDCEVLFVDDRHLLHITPTVTISVLGCFVLAEFLLTSTSCGPSAIAELLGSEGDIVQQ